MFNIKVTLWDKIWFRTTDFFDNWIYPGYYLKNVLFKRYDLIKIPEMKCFHYNDVSERLKLSVFELIKKFIEEEDPEKHICWYTDKETGEELGHKYGESMSYLPVMFPELKGKWIMDLIKEIYDFYTNKLPALKDDISYLLKINHEYFVNLHMEELPESKDKPEEEKFYHLVNKSPKRTLDDPELQNLNWDLILKYTDKKENILGENNLTRIIQKCEFEKDKQIQYYLHLAIEVRPFLWT